MIEQTEQIKKIGDERIARERYIPPEEPRRAITKDGLVLYGESVKKLIKEDGDKAIVGADKTLKHVTGEVSENIAFMKQLGIDQELAKTARQIDALVATSQRKIETTENVDI